MIADLKEHAAVDYCSAVVAVAVVAAAVAAVSGPFSTACKQNHLQTQNVLRFVENKIPGNSKKKNKYPEGEIT